MLRAVIIVGGGQFEKETLKVHSFLQERHKLQVIRKLLFSMDPDKQLDVLTERIPDMGINSCYVSLFQDQEKANPEKAVCILAMRDKKRIDAQSLPKEFPPEELVPDGFLSDPGQHMLIVEAMKEISFIVFEMGDKFDRFYPYLSDIICGAVQGAVLFTGLEKRKKTGSKPQSYPPGDGRLHPDDGGHGGNARSVHRGPFAAGIGSGADHCPGDGAV